LFLIVMLGSGLAWYLGGSFGLEARLISFANHPEARASFQDPVSGQSDALVMLISFAILTPLAAGVVLMAVVMLIKMFETLLVSLRLPGWLSAPIVVAAVVYGVCATTQLWFSDSLYAVGLVSRAYLVYSYGTVPAFH